MPIIGVLAVQGNFREHAAVLTELGAKAHFVRNVTDLVGVDALIFPGGESTAMTRILERAELITPLQDRIDAGMPCFGSCAGLILLARQLLPADERVHTFSAIDITVQRNAFGRQSDSFEAELDFTAVTGGAVTAVFIRAPVIERCSPEVTILATVDSGPHAGRVVAAQQGATVVTAFHPEMTAERRIHEHFLAGIS